MSGREVSDGEMAWCWSSYTAIGENVIYCAICVVLKHREDLWSTVVIYTRSWGSLAIKDWSLNDR